jgi:alpha-galactosidase
LSAAGLETASFQSCRASWDGRSLILSNAHIERQWQVQKGLLTPTSFRDLASGAEWLKPPAPAPSSTPSSTPASPPGNWKFTSRSGSMSPVEAPSLVVQLTSPSGVAYRFQLFPDAQGVLTRADPLESLTLNSEHIHLTQVTLMDQTDNHNQLVFENDWLPQRNEKDLHLEGNLFIAENTLTHAGLIFLKLAPLPLSRPVRDAWDLESAVHGRGLQCNFNAARYPYVVLAYNGGRAGRTEALQTFQRQLRLYVPSRDAMFISNTWGDRSRDARINSEFMRQEIDAGAALGVDVIQIDDGWQTGRTSNSARGPGVWTGYWAQNPNFWQPDLTRFPGGLKPLVQQAASKSIKFGLWFGPDSSNDFSNWERDAGRLLELHNQDGIDYFKIDGVKALTPAGEHNLRQMFDRVQQQTNGKVVFDLDVTAEIRPGYFGVPDVGPLFVENRYTDFHGYWPHQTLRNLWQLAQYVDPLRLRMEVLNNERNPLQYAGDPLAPAKYSPDFLFATVMFANPLGWFEISNLPPQYLSQMSKLVATWKAHRAAIFSDTILPMGEAPDGADWTGFAAFAKDRDSGYVLIFRGIGTPEEWTTHLPVFHSPHPIKLLGGEGAVALEQGELNVRIPNSPGFVWAKIN